MPALILVFCLTLFVRLIFETAKISREKIRHQFAVDAAAFIEMTNYSDFLNRTAYVNGAFPHRIFKETLEGLDPILGKDNSTYVKIYEMLYQNAAFPKTDQTLDDSSLPRWPIGYADSDKAGRGERLNQLSYTRDPEDLGTLDFVTEDNAYKTYIAHKDVMDIYQLYAQIYSLLGSVEDAQWQVFKRLTDNANFFRKSYWLNSGDCTSADNCGEQGAQAFKGSPLRAKLHKVTAIELSGNQFNQSNLFNPISVLHNRKKFGNAIEIPDGLFQLTTVNEGNLRRLKYGYEVIQPWDPPAENYFNVDLKAFRPRVRARVVSGGGVVWNEGSPGNPSPTPKFQTRLYP